MFPDGDRKLSVCYMKGRNNYLCRKKLIDLTDLPVLSGLEEIEHYRAIAAWEKTTKTGDRAELAELPETSALWHKLDARADTCLGQKCKEYDRCFITEMRRRAAESDIIIVNHHLFFADLSIKLEAEGAPDAGVLPDCGAVIFDEAHELEDIAGNYFGISVSNLRMDELTRDAEHLLQREKLYTPQMSGAIQSVRERSQLFFSLLPPNEGRFAFDSRREFLEENGEEFITLNQSLYRLAAELEQLPQKPEEVFTVARRAQQLQVQLRFVMENEDPNTVFWIERRGVGAGRSAARFERARLQPRRNQSFENGASAPDGRSPAERTFFSRPPQSKSARSCANAYGQSSNFSAHLGDPSRRRRIRVHSPAPRPRSRPRIGRRLALRLRNPGDLLRSAQSARPAHSAIRQRGQRTSSSACSRLLADAPSSSSPATRR